MSPDPLTLESTRAARIDRIAKLIRDKAWESPTELRDREVARELAERIVAEMEHADG